MTGISGVSGVSGLSAMVMRPMASITAVTPDDGGFAAAGPTASAPGGFAAAMGEGINKLQTLQATSDSLAVRAATGDLSDIHDYTIAAGQAKLATDLTVAVRNKAVDAFTEIMRMTI